MKRSMLFALLLTGAILNAAGNKNEDPMYYMSKISDVLLKKEKDEELRKKEFENKKLKEKISLLKVKADKNKQDPYTEETLENKKKAKLVESVSKVTKRELMPFGYSNIAGKKSVRVKVRKMTFVLYKGQCVMEYCVESIDEDNVIFKTPYGEKISRPYYTITKKLKNK